MCSLLDETCKPLPVSTRADGKKSEQSTKQSPGQRRTYKTTTLARILTESCNTCISSYKPVAPLTSVNQTAWALQFIQKVHV